MTQMSNEGPVVDRYDIENDRGDGMTQMDQISQVADEIDGSAEMIVRNQRHETDE